MPSFKQSEHQVGAELPGSSYVILDPRVSRYYQLNSVGRAIWELLKEPATQDEIVESLVRRYEIERADCEREVMEFLERLSLDGLVVLV